MRGVIFDLDGTLVDSLDDIRAAMNHVLRGYGLPERSAKEIERYVGEGARMLVRRALGDAAGELEDQPLEDQALEDQALDRFRERYLQNLVVHTRPYPGIPELLATLRSRGTPTGVLSNKPHDATREVVAALFAGHPFVGILGHRPDVPRKPDPEGALELAEALGVEPARVLFVGDTAVDVETALAAGMEPVAVLWGMRSREQLEAAGAARFLAQPRELLDLL